MELSRLLLNFQQMTYRFAVCMRCLGNFQVSSNLFNFLINLFLLLKNLIIFFYLFSFFTAIRRFKLILSETEVDSREIEDIINPPTNLFNKVNYLEIDDKSGNRCTLGLFLGLFKNFRNITSLKIQSTDGNINVLLQEFLPRMTNLTEIYIDSMAPRKPARLNIIRNFVPSLAKMWVVSEYVEETKQFFGDQVEVLPTNAADTKSNMFI